MQRYRLEAIRFLVGIVLIVAGVGDVKPAVGLHAASVDSTRSGGRISFEPSLEALDGTQVPLSEFAGKVLFVNVWASWCAPCVAEMPSIQRLRSSMAGNPVEFLLVSIDEERSAVPRFLRRHDLEDLPVYFFLPETGTVGITVTTVPATFIIDGEGNIIYRHDGFRDWDDKEVRALLLGYAAEVRE